MTFQTSTVTIGQSNKTLRKNLAKVSDVVRKCEDNAAHYDIDDDEDEPPTPEGNHNFGNKFVCFHSRAADGLGRHSMLAVNGLNLLEQGHFALPPFTTVCVDQIEKLDNRKLFHVSITW